MQIKFYNNKSDNDEVHKSISLLDTKDCKIYEDCTIQNPRFIVNMVDNLTSANYIYIEKWNRYYYINNITIKDGTIAIVDCSVDVLMSFWNEFKNSICIAERSASKYNQYLQDNMVAFSSQTRYEYRKLPFIFTPNESGKHYVLTMGGNI